ncbi:hypothetical protein [Vampirovibrio sp.]|uniref:hypothetical protein n=1 Tax=Vampirovibrio sp. TaxID=2717857 RepID=UPI0035933A1A
MSEVQPSDDKAESKKPFPLNVVRLGEGWSVALLMENGENKQLLKPGWQGENKAPYLFNTEQEAWNFIKQMFNFCLQQSRMQHTTSEKIKNCGQCGKIFKATIFDHCHQCLQENEFVLQQIWQGFYYLAGSESGALQKAAFLLKIPYEDFAQVPEAFQAMVQKHLDLNIALEKSRSDRAKVATEITHSPVAGLRSSNFRNAR